MLMENVEKRPVLNYVLLLVLFMLLLIGNLQRAVEDDPNFDPDIVRLDNGKNKYFLNDPIPVAVENDVDSEGYPAWYSRSIEDLLLDASSIQELLSNLGITHEESTRTCRPHRHIVFLKKHKCASSTIFEILNRFKKKHKLYAASKPLASFVGGYPGKFKPEFVAPPQTDKYDIIFNHFRWDEAAVRSVTHDDTIFLTSIREPLSHYKSVFDFFYGSYKRESGMVDHACNLACEGQPFLAMLGRAGEHFEKYMDCIPECYNASLPWSFRARNFQTFEMGLDAGPNFISDLAQFTKAMDFVMITEKFAESILVMRKLLCMDFMDLYVQPKKVKTHDEVQFSTKQKARFYQFNNYDLEMYNHFNSTFDEQVEKLYGKKNMEIDTRRLKIIRSYCDKKENIKECINQADKTRFTYSGKDDRKYWPNDIDWPKFAKYMADAGGACPYGTFGSLLKNEILPQCRVYQWTISQGYPSNNLNDFSDQNSDEDSEDEDDDSDYR